MGKKIICILLLLVICALLSLMGVSAYENRYFAVLLDGGYEIEESFAENNKVGYGQYDENGVIRYYDKEGIERPKEIVRVINSEKDAKCVFSRFSEKIDYKNEMLIIYVFMSISPRQCKVRKTKKENNVVYVELRYQRKYFVYDTTSPQQMIFVIKMKKTEAKEFRIKLD